MCNFTLYFKIEYYLRTQNKSVWIYPGATMALIPRGWVGRQRDTFNELNPIALCDSSPSLSLCGLVRGFRDSECCRVKKSESAQKQTECSSVVAAGLERIAAVKGFNGAITRCRLTRLPRAGATIVRVRSLEYATSGERSIKP